MATPQQDYKVLNTLTNEQLKNKYIDIMNTNFKYADQHILKHANKLIERLFKTKSTETLSKQKFEDKLAMTIWAMDQTLEASSTRIKPLILNGRMVEQKDYDSVIYMLERIFIYSYKGIWTIY